MKWLDTLPEEEARKYLKDLLLKRKEKKNLIYSPCQVELRTIFNPSIITYEKKFPDYYKLCKSLGFKNKYKNLKNQITAANRKDEDLKIYVDTREQLPLKFNIASESKALKFGDYALSDKSLTCNCYIERKS